MKPKNYPLYIEQGATVRKRLQFNFDATYKTIVAQLWAKNRKTKLADFAIEWVDKPTGVFYLVLLPTITATINQEALWELMVIDNPSQERYYYLTGRADWVPISILTAFESPPPPFLAEFGASTVTLSIIPSSTGVLTSENLPDISGVSQATLDMIGSSTGLSDDIKALPVLSGTSQAALPLTGSASGTVIDLQIVTLDRTPSTVTEDGLTNIVFTFTRTGSLGSALTVNYTIDGTATDGTDFVAS